MDLLDERPYRHERLGPGSFHIPGTVHLHFDLGADRDMQRKLRDRLLQSGATPKESLILEPAPRYMVSIPLGLREELSQYALPSLRLLDDLDVEPCHVELEHVLARQDSAGEVRLVEPIDAEHWLDVRTGYEHTRPGVLHVHQAVSFPKTGPQPEIEEISTWSTFVKPDTWCFRSARSLKLSHNEIPALLRRDSARLASLIKGVPGAQFSIVVEQVLACWDYPLEAAGNNRHRTSMKQMTGISDRRIPDLATICERCQRSGPALIAHDESERAEIISEMEPFRRMALKQDLTPLVVGLALVPTSAGAAGPRFADYFHTQAAAYAATPQDAEALLETYRNTLWFLSRSGYSPVMATPDTSEQVLFWSTVLPGLQPARKKTAGNGRTPAELAIAAGRQTLTLAPLKQYKSFEDTVMEQLGGFMRRSSNPLLRDAGLIGVPFRNFSANGGDYLSGCFFALVTAPELDRSRLQELAACVTIVLHRLPFRRPVAANPEPVPTKTTKRVLSEVRIRQVIQHDTLWTAIENVCDHAEGSRMKRMADHFPAAFALFTEYPKLLPLKSEIEHASKLTAIVEAAWKAISDRSPSNLFLWRNKAGLPSRRLS